MKAPPPEVLPMPSPGGIRRRGGSPVFHERTPLEDILHVDDEVLYGHMRGGMRKAAGEEMPMEASGETVNDTWRAGARGVGASAASVSLVPSSVVVRADVVVPRGGEPPYVGKTRALFAGQAAAQAKWQAASSSGRGQESFGAAEAVGGGGGTSSAQRSGMHSRGGLRGAAGSVLDGGASTSNERGVLERFVAVKNGLLADGKTFLDYYALREACDAEFGIKGMRNKSLRDAMFAVSRMLGSVNTAVEATLATHLVMTLHDLEHEVLLRMRDFQFAAGGGFNEVGLGPLAAHPRVIQAFSLDPTNLPTHGPFPITVTDLMAAFAWDGKSVCHALDVGERLESVAAKRGLTCARDLHVAVRAEKMVEFVMRLTNSRWRKAKQAQGKELEDTYELACRNYLIHTLGARMHPAEKTLAQLQALARGAGENVARSLDFVYRHCYQSLRSNNVELDPPQWEFDDEHDEVPRANLTGKEEENMKLQKWHRKVNIWVRDVVSPLLLAAALELRPAPATDMTFSLHTQRSSEDPSRALGDVDSSGSEAEQEDGTKVYRTEVGCFVGQDLTLESLAKAAVFDWGTLRSRMIRAMMRAREGTIGWESFGREVRLARILEAARGEFNANMYKPIGDFVDILVTETRPEVLRDICQIAFEQDVPAQAMNGILFPASESVEKDRKTASVESQLIEHICGLLGDKSQALPDASPISRLAHLEATLLGHWRVGSWSELGVDSTFIAFCAAKEEAMGLSGAFYNFVGVDNAQREAVPPVGPPSPRDAAIDAVSIGIGDTSIQSAAKWLVYAALHKEVAVLQRVQNRLEFVTSNGVWLEMWSSLTTFAGVKATNEFASPAAEASAKELFSRLIWDVTEHPFHNDVAPRIIPLTVFASFSAPQFVEAELASDEVVCLRITPRGSADCSNKSSSGGRRENLGKLTLADGLAAIAAVPPLGLVHERSQWEALFEADLGPLRAVLAANPSTNVDVAFVEICKGEFVKVPLPKDSAVGLSALSHAVSAAKGASCMSALVGLQVREGMGLMTFNDGDVLRGSTAKARLVLANAMSSGPDSLTFVQEALLSCPRPFWEGGAVKALVDAVVDVNKALSLEEFVQFGDRRAEDKARLLALLKTQSNSSALAAPTPGLIRRVMMSPSQDQDVPLVGNVEQEVKEFDMRSSLSSAAAGDLMGPKMMELDTSAPKLEIDAESSGRNAALLSSIQVGLGMNLESKLGDAADRESLEQLRGIVTRSVHRLAEELYAEDIHFLLEIIQNCDDNRYVDGVVPTLKVTLDRDGNRLRFDNNEVGFNEANVRALCSIGQSTKALASGYIGHKGIGFKSVFKVTNAPQVHSRVYHFAFDSRAHGGLGYVVPAEVSPPPNWTVDDYGGGTTLVLPLKDETVWHDFFLKIDGLHPSILLFLNKLACIEIVSTNGACLKRIELIGGTRGGAHALFRGIADISACAGPGLDLSVVEICSSEGGEDCNNVVTTTSEIFLKVSKTLRAVVPHDRLGGSPGASTKLCIAFPLSRCLAAAKDVENNIAQGKINGVVSIGDEEADATPLDLGPLAQCNVFAFLPLRSYGFRFIVQGDWILPSSREAIDASSTWNKWLRDELALMICEGFASVASIALQAWGTGSNISMEVLLSQLYRSVPVMRQTTEFFRGTPQQVAEHLFGCPFILSEFPRATTSGQNAQPSLVPPSRAVLLPAADGQLLSSTFLRSTQDFLGHLGKSFVSRRIHVPSEMAEALRIRALDADLMCDLVGVALDLVSQGALSLSEYMAWLGPTLAIIQAPIKYGILGIGHLQNRSGHHAQAVLGRLRTMAFLPIEGAGDPLHLGSVASNDHPIYDCREAFEGQSLSKSRRGKSKKRGKSKTSFTPRVLKVCQAYALARDFAAGLNEFPETNTLLARIGVVGLQSEAFVRNEVIPWLQADAADQLDDEDIVALLAFVKSVAPAAAGPGLTVITCSGARVVASPEAEIHFGLAYGGDQTLHEALGDSWITISPRYLEADTCDTTSWVTFLESLGVSYSPHICRTSGRIDSVPSATQRIWSALNLIEEFSDDTIVLDVASPELERILEDITSRYLLGERQGRDAALLTLVEHLGRWWTTGDPSLSDCMEASASNVPCRLPSTLLLTLSATRPWVPDGRGGLVWPFECVRHEYRNGELVCLTVFPRVSKIPHAMLQCIGVPLSATVHALLAGILGLARGDEVGGDSPRGHRHTLDSMSALYSAMRDLMITPTRASGQDEGTSFDFTYALSRLGLYGGFRTADLLETLRTTAWVWVPDHPRMLLGANSARPSRKLSGSTSLEGRFLRPADCVWDEPSKTMDSLNQTVSDEMCRMCAQAGMPRVLSRYYGEAKVRELFVNHGGVAEKPTMAEYIALLTRIAASHRIPDGTSATVIFRTLCNLSYPVEWCDHDEEEDAPEDTATDASVSTVSEQKRFRNFREFAAALREALHAAGNVLVGRSVRGGSAKWVGLGDGPIYVDDSSSGMLPTSFGQVVDIGRSISSEMQLDLLTTSSAWVQGISGFVKDLEANLDRLFCDILGIPRLSSSLAERMSDASAEGVVPVSLGCMPEAVAVVYFLQVWSASALDAVARRTLQGELTGLSLAIVDRIVPAVKLDSPGCIDFPVTFVGVPCLLDLQRKLLAVTLDGGDMGARIARQLTAKLIPRRTLSRDAERYVCAALGILSSSPSEVLMGAGWEDRLRSVALRLSGMGSDGEQSPIEQAFVGGVWLQPAELRVEVEESQRRGTIAEVNNLTQLMRGALALSRKGKGAVVPTQSGDFDLEGGLISALSGLHAERQRFREDRVRFLESGGQETFAQAVSTVGRGIAGGDHGPAVGGYLGPSPESLSSGMQRIAETLATGGGQRLAVAAADVDLGARAAGTLARFQGAGEFSVDFEDVPTAEEVGEDSFGHRAAAKIQSAGNVYDARGTGRWGEAFVAMLLEEAAVPGATVNWVNRDAETGMPYDIAVEGDRGERIFIEVKTTRMPGDVERPSTHHRDFFELSLAELDFARVQGERYLLYRVFVGANGGTTVRRLRDPVSSLRPGGLGLLMVT